MNSVDPHKRIADMIEGAAVSSHSGVRQPPDEGGGEPDPCDSLGPSDAGDSGADPKVVELCARFDHSDTDNGKRLREHFGRDLCVMAQSGVSGGAYLVWGGTHWDQPSGEAMAQIVAQQLGGRIAQEAEYLRHTPDELAAVKAAEGIDPEDGGKDAKALLSRANDARKALARRKAARRSFAVTSKNTARCDNMLKMAAPHLRRSPDDFNADAFLAATLTHTLRFIRGEEDPGSAEAPIYKSRVEVISGHRREDLLTGVIPYPYEPKAVPKKWLAFLARCMPDAVKLRTVQQYCGTALFGFNLQYLMFHHGFGANGKSVFLETLTRLLGESFAIGLPAESISGGGERAAGGPSPDIERLFGKRMVRVLELAEGKALQEDLVKRLTGGEAFPVRTLFKGFYEFKNRATPHMSGNGFPRIDGTDNGIWRRMLVVHWSVTIPKEERRDLEEMVADLLTEGPGILNWLIAGALDFLAHGLVVAPDIEKATESYREDMDPIGRFVADCVEVEPGQSVGARAMYMAYVNWSAANALRPRAETKFGLEMKKRFTRDEKRTRSYLDCRLHDVPAAPDSGGGTSWPEGYGG
jgi:putative DNA primase/helicase